MPSVPGAESEAPGAVHVNVAAACAALATMAEAQTTAARARTVRRALVSLTMVVISGVVCPSGAPSFPNPWWMRTERRSVKGRSASRLEHSPTRRGGSGGLQRGDQTSAGRSAGAGSVKAADG
jgi:hypothetical protein